MYHACRRRRWLSRVTVFALCFVAIAGGVTSSLSAQRVGVGIPVNSQMPPQAYYAALEFYRDGDIENAMEALEQARRATRTEVNGKWIDAIPVQALAAECYWQLGDLEACQAASDEAIRIAVRNRGWLSRIRWDQLQANRAIVAPTRSLWPGAAAVNQLPLPGRLSFMSGEMITEQRLQQGGVIEPPSIQKIDGIEIMRGLAMIGYRRRVVMGPLAQEDTMSRELLEATKYPAGLNVALAQGLISAMRGAEYLAIGEDKTVMDRAGKYGLLGGAAHPLTPILLLGEMRVAARGDEQGNLTEATRAALVAKAEQIANTAGALEQPEWIGEAMQIAAGVALPQQTGSVERASLVAANALVRRSRLAALHCFLTASDAALGAGRVDAADQHLQAALSLASQRDMVWPRLEAYGSYLAARVAAARGGRIGGNGGGPVNAAMSAMTDFMLRARDRNRSLVTMPYDYQLRIINQMVGRSMGNQSATLTLQAYAGDASIVRWRHDPLDALTASLTDRGAVQTALARLAVAQNDPAGTLRATDRVLADRFLARLPLHGRLLQFRTLLSSPEALLSDQERMILNAGPPALLRARRQVQASLVVPVPEQEEPAPNGQPEGEDQEKKREEIAKRNAEAAAGRSVAAAAALESLISQWTLSRLVLPPINPPPVSEVDLEALPEGTGLMAFWQDGQRLMVMRSTATGTRAWAVPAGRRLLPMVRQLLQEIGASRNRGQRLPDSEQWRETATAIRQLLFPEPLLIEDETIDRWIIVPDGPLWYLPFELLPTTRDADLQVQPAEAGDEGDDAAQQADGEPAEISPKVLWGDLAQIAYAPTPGFALHDVGVGTTGDRIAMVAGRFFAPRLREDNERAIEEILMPVESPLRSEPGTLSASSRLPLDIGHLIVAAPVTPNLSDPLATSVVPSAGGPGNASGSGGEHQLRDWLLLPAGGPKTVSLPGFRTAAGASQLGDGNELFMPLTALRASGVREVMISRWATGGHSAAIVVGELASELPFTTMGEAFSRGIRRLRGARLPVAGEPLLGAKDEAVEALTGNQPLFWASYLHTDSVALPPAPSNE